MTSREVAESTEEAAALLEAAADLLETKSWIQGHYTVRDFAGVPVAHCAVGAMEQVAGESGILGFYLDPVAMLAMVKVRDRLPSDKYGIPVGLEDWNDQPGRTASEVIDLFKHTAKDLRNRKAAA